MVMLEHDDTLHTRHGIERVMFRGRYGAVCCSGLVHRAIARSARAPKSACSGESGRGELRDETCEPPVTGYESVGRVCRLIDLISSPAIDYIK